MFVLVAGLIAFLGVHSVRIVAEPWRTRRIERLGEGKWKGLYSLVSIAGLAFWVVFALYLHAWLIGVRPFA